MKVRYENYGNYSSTNYGTHTLVFTDSIGYKYYFSYTTLIAFYTPKSGLVIRDNVWGPTTGKHLNWINEDKTIRKTSEEFNELYKKYCL